MTAFIRFKTLAAVCLIVGIAALLLAEPAWWVQRGVRDPAKDPSDYAVLNQGQLKNLARAARDEMNDYLIGGAGDQINTLVDGWNNPTANTSDFAVVTAGQLKALAKFFYDRLIAAGRASSYPWTDGTEDDKDFAVVNLGQAKQVFGFDVFMDANTDGVDDIWEASAGQSGTGGTGTGWVDTDGDGVSDSQEEFDHTDPNNAASSAATLTGLVVWTRAD